MCSRCKISNCPGPDNCLIDCLTCDDEEIAGCPAAGCDMGYLPDADGELTIRCKKCNGKGEVRCPDC